MAQIYIQYNPYRLETTIKIDGQEISPDNKLYQNVEFALLDAGYYTT